MPDVTHLQKDLLGVSSEFEWQQPVLKLGNLDLESNLGTMQKSEMRWLRPVPATTSGEDILRELETKGVVHVKGVMPREYVLGMRKRWFEHVAPCGILKEHTDPVDGIYCGNEDTHLFLGPENAPQIKGPPEENAHFRLTSEAVQSDWANAFAENEDLLRFVKKIHPEWSSPFCLRRQLFRSNLPFAKGVSTGVHYDHIFLRAGPPTVLTGWVPIGDCNPLQGGLIYLSDSMGLAIRQEEEFDRMCREKGMTDEEKLDAFNSNMQAQGMLSRDAGHYGRTEGQGHKWLIGDYEAGDVVFHHSYMIHASGRNVDPSGKIRLSADLRFADRDAPYDHRWDKQVVTTSCLVLADLCSPWRTDDGL